MKNSNKKITPEQKRMYIGYGIIGFFALIIIVYAVNDFSSDEENQKVEDFATPETEANKYNSKLEAINGGKEQDTTINGDLLNYSNDPVVESTKDTVADLEIKKEPILIEKTTTPKPKKAVAIRKVPKKEVTKTVVKEEIIIPQEEPKLNSRVNSDKINNFFKSNKTKTEAVKESVIVATIKGDQLGVKNNQRVTLILSKEVSLNDKVFPKNTLIYAKATFTENRVNLTITNINQIPLNLWAYDAQDGNLGLQVSQSLVSESTNGVVDNQTDELGVSDIPVVGRTLSKIVKKRVKEVKIDLLNNQKVILKPLLR